MLVQAQLAADASGIRNIEWVRARAEDLPGAAPGPYRVVTFASSFHWTDELRVAEIVYDMLEPGGAIVMVAHSADGRPVPPSPGHPPIPHDELQALVIKYLGSLTRMGQGLAPVRNHKWQDILVQTRFETYRELWAPGIPDLLRDTDSVISGYLSMSYSAPHLYGDRLDEFGAEAQALLESKSSDGLFWDWPGDTAIVVARK